MIEAEAPEASVSIRVLVVDDQELVRTGLRMILEREPDLTVVGEAADGLAAIDEAACTKPDIVLMDVRMPGLDGVEATSRILAADPGTRVIILTTFDLDQYVYAGLRAGASGFLLKDALADDLLRAVRVIAAGDAVLAPAATRRLLERFVTTMPAAQMPGPYAPATLTEREREVWELIARGLSNAQIAARLYLTEGTVKSHVSRILNKLQLTDRVQAVILAYETGIVHVGRQNLS